MIAATRVLPVEPLTREAFAPFGDLIAPDARRETIAINAGSARRHPALAAIETIDGGQATIGLVQASPRALPFAVTMLERHPLGTQAFIPRDGTRWIVVVASDPDATPRAFLAARGEGVSYRRGTWHHPLIALDAGGWFVVVDRTGPGANCDEVTLATAWRLDAPV